MNLEPECIPCMLRQALREARQVTDDGEVLKRVLRAVLSTLQGERWEGPPTLTARKVHSTVRKILNVKDPYLGVKRASNEMALKFYPWAQELVKRSKDPLETAMKLSIAGNVLDYAAMEAPDLKGTIESVLKAEPAINDYPMLRRMVMKSRRLTFFADNAGEIVFDRLFIETMELVKGRPFEKILLVVKGGPVVNDATKEDAEMAGLTEMENVELVEISDEGPGLSASSIRSDLSELNVMKGQGNYEVFGGLSNVFFLLMVKCPVIGKALGVEIGRPVVYFTRPI